MLTLPLIHPPLIRALALAGHGSKVLIADGNFPYATVRHPMAEIVHLNLAPGLLSVDQVLAAVLSAVTVEAAQIMGPDDGSEVDSHRSYRAALPEASFERVGRWDFYDIVRSQDVGLIIATGDQRTYANLLLTIGLG
jgi:L-fucose mutarotase